MRRIAPLEDDMYAVRRIDLDAASDLEARQFIASEPRSSRSMAKGEYNTNVHPISATMLSTISVVGMLASVAASTKIIFYTTDLGCNGAGVNYIDVPKEFCVGNPTENYSSARLVDSPRADDLIAIYVPSAERSRCGNSIAFGVRGQCLSSPDAEIGGIAGAKWNPRNSSKRSILEEREGETALPSEAFLADGTTFDINNGVPSERTEKIMDLLWLKGGFATVDDVPAELVPFIKS
ncbi:hypothetical protein KC318_g12217 [Hortaea werneckii]|nr:hypothetical protein KC334_g12422 [Hortaea werneckii]KAI6964542.1 hypothetical protein KC355_g12314 [Hortaea werneckii]KAI7656735.1 hypothetical protein KC318_g12217 [Hortaea werneckii]